MQAFGVPVDGAVVKFWKLQPAKARSLQTR